MLELKGISKDYTAGSVITTALDDVNLCFRTKEFVAIQGRSGAGKTTLLNLIAGLTQPTSGCIIFKGRNMTEFQEREWDAYRNNSVGIIFQNCCLINHLSILENVMLKLEISGMPFEERKQKALDLLKRVGLEEKAARRSDQLSGGEQQRVVIARALSNDPEILLCDEPTGLLDDKTGTEIIEIIQKEARNRLVIMVTHDNGLAGLYADRLIRIENGRIMTDSKPYHMGGGMTEFTLKKQDLGSRAMCSFAIRGFRRAKRKTVLLVLGYAVSILCVCLALSLSVGFRTAVDSFEEKIMTSYPILVSTTKTKVLTDSIRTINEEEKAADDAAQAAKEEASDSGDVVHAVDYDAIYTQHTNVFNDIYLKYIKKIDPEICSEIGVVRSVTMNMVRVNEEKMAVPVVVTPGDAVTTSGTDDSSGIRLAVFPSRPGEDQVTDYSFIKENYDCIAGRYPSSKTDLCLVVDENNGIDQTTLANLGFSTDEGTDISMDKIAGMTLYLIGNDTFYKKTGTGSFEPRTDYDAMLSDENNLELHLSGILRIKEDGKAILRNGVVYGNDLVDTVIERERSSAVVVAQRSSDHSVLTGEVIDSTAKEKLLVRLGGEQYPSAIILYPSSFASKEKVLTYLSAYNTEDMSGEEQIFARDLAKEVTGGIGGILRGVSVGLLIVTILAVINCFTLMILMTSESVKIRVREIGILRALGVHIRDVRNIFMLRSGIIGFATGLFGITMAEVLKRPINSILFRVTGLTDVMQFTWIPAAALLVFSVLITLAASFFPASTAAQHDTAELLTAE